MGNLLHVVVRNKIATFRQRDGSIVCGNKDYSVQFSFDAEWEEHTVKTARFIYNSHVVDRVFEGDTVEVPVLRDTTLVAVGVFAGDLHTTTPAIIPCRKSILCSEGLPPDPEPDVYAQIMEMMGNGGSGDNSNNLQPVDGHLIGGANLVDDVRTLKVNGEADESNLIKFKGAPRAVEPGELVGRWVMINGRRGYVGTNTVDTLVLFTDETKSETLDITCPSGTIIYPADIEVTSIHGIEIRPIASKVVPMWDSSLHSVDGHLIGGPNLGGDVRTLKVNGEVDESNLIKFKGATVEPGSLVGRWVMIAERRGYIGTNTVDTLVLFTDETKTETLDITCPSGTIIYPADIEVTSIHGIEIRPIASKVVSMWDRSLHPVDGHLIGGANLVDDVRTLKVNGEADESNLIKFKGAPRAVKPGELVGRWVMINGRRGYVATNTVDTLVLWTDETKSETLDITCPSGTTIYPADIHVGELPAVTTADNGKVLKVVNGVWRAVTL